MCQIGHWSDRSDENGLPPGTSALPLPATRSPDRGWGEKRSPFLDEEQMGQGVTTMDNA